MATERSSSTGLVVRPLTRRDLAFAADLHGRCLPHGLFPRLGRRFLRRYYSTFVRSPWAVGLVAEADGRPIGLLVGTIDNLAHYRFVTRKCWAPLMSAGIASLAVRPGVAWWFLRTRCRRYARGLARLAGWSHGGKGPTMAPSGSVVREGVLSHAMVEEDARGSGAGAELVSTFVASARRRGTTRLRLLTHPSDGAAEFYGRLGWMVAGEHTGFDGTTWTELRFDIE